MSAKYRDRLLNAAVRFATARDDSETYLAEVDAIMLEISEREDTILRLLRRLLDTDYNVSPFDQNHIRAEAERDARDFLKAKP